MFYLCIPEEVAITASENFSIMADSDSSDSEIYDFEPDFLDSSDESDEEFDGFDPIDIVRNRGVLVELPLVDFRPSIDNEVDADLQSGWGVSDDGCFRAPFIGESRLNVDLESTDPIDFFKLFIDNDFIATMTNETNVYAQQKIDRMRQQGTLKPYSHLQKWTPVTTQEMMVFLAVVVNMGLVYKPNLESYWSTDPATEIPFFGKTMPRDR